MKYIANYQLYHNKYIIEITLLLIATENMNKLTALIIKIYLSLLTFHVLNTNYTISIDA
jgi:hypothetical protein